LYWQIVPVTHTLLGALQFPYKHIGTGFVGLAVVEIKVGSVDGVVLGELETYPPEVGSLELREVGLQKLRWVLLKDLLCHLEL